MSFKVAASDFDGTIYRNEKISDDDIAAVRALSSCLSRC